LVRKLPMSLGELNEAGGFEALVRAPGEDAMRREREFWLEILQRYKRTRTFAIRSTVSPIFAAGSASNQTSIRYERKRASGRGSQTTPSGSSHRNNCVQPSLRGFEVAFFNFFQSLFHLE
jgi:hypothetical protein